MNTFQYPLKLFSNRNDNTYLVEGIDSFLFDNEGKKYFDCISGLWNVSLGYRNERIINVIEKQLYKLPFINMITEESNLFSRYADELIKVLPMNQKKIMVTTSGSEAVELAIKISKKYQLLRGNADKKKICSLDLSYHGTSYMAMVVSGMDRSESRNYTDLKDVMYIPAPYCQCCRILEMSEQCKVKIINQITEVFNNYGKEFAALIIEPIIGSGGIIPLPPWYINILVKVCNMHNVLIIDDEVATGFGRTGNMFAVDALSINPDLVCMSKGINNGYLPFGAVSLSNDVYREFIIKNQFVEHFSTQNGNLLSCVAAMETLDILIKNNFIDIVEKNGKGFLKELQERLLPIQGVWDVRGKGLMIGIDLKDKNNAPFSIEKLHNIYAELKNRGLLVYYFYVKDIISGISLFPQFITEEKTFISITKIIQRVLSKHLRYIY